MLKTLSAAALLAAAAQAQAPFVISNFDDRSKYTTLSPFGSGDWFFLSDADSHGNTVITSGDTTMQPALIDSNSWAPGFGASGYSLKLAFTFGTLRPHGEAPDTGSWDPEVGLGTEVFDTAGMSPGNITGAVKVTFRAKADNNLKARFLVGTADIKDYAYYGKDITVTMAWQEFTVTFTETAFAQPTWRTVAKAFRPDSVLSFQFNISKAFNAALPSTAFYLDDFTIHGWTPPVGVRGKGPRMRGALAAVRGGDGLRVTLPEAQARIGGRVEVYGASGRQVATAEFRAGERELKIALPGKVAKGERLMVRVVGE